MLPPHPKKEHFLLKNVYYLSKDKVRFFVEQQKEMGNTYLVTSPFRGLIVTTEPDYIQQILQTNNKNYIKSFAYDVLRLFLGNGLLTSEGDFWRRQRRLAQPAFYKEKLVAIGEVMQKCTENLLQEWEKEANMAKWMNISFEMNKIALDIVSQSLFFSDIKDYDIHRISDNVTQIIEIGESRISTPWTLPLSFPTPENLRFKRSRKMMDDLMYEIIEKRRKAAIPQLDLLSMLMEAKDEETGESMSNEQLRDEVLTIFMAGHETTANALSWIWYLLGKNPDKMQILQAEIDAVLQGKPIQLEDLRQLSYTKQVIEESMRLYPPAWVMGRKTVEADKFGDFDIPAGYNVVVPIFVAHRNPAIWENPENFEPERFTADKMKDKHRFAYLPFGGGPRLCIGNSFAMMEMQIIIAMVLQRFDLEFDPNYQAILNPLITLRPKNPVQVRIRKRR